MVGVLRIPIFLFSLIAVSFAYSATKIQVSETDVDGSMRAELSRTTLETQISAGAWDRFQIKFKIDASEISASDLSEWITEENEIYFLKLTMKSFQKASSHVRGQILDRLTSYYGKWSEQPVYRAEALGPVEDFENNPMMEWLGTPLSEIDFPYPAHQLLSDYAKKWAYQATEKHGPNCWHSSMASIFPEWKNSRYMSPAEFTCLVKTYFDKIPQPDQWGDLIRMQSIQGEEIHGFTFLGDAANVPGEKIVFSKNGYKPGHYLFQTLSTVRQTYYYAGPALSYYRANRPAIDPSVDPSAPCRMQWEAFQIGNSRGEILDPLIEAGMQKIPPSHLEPIQLDKPSK